MGQLDLAVFIRQHPGLRPLQHAEPASLETRRVLAGDDPLASRLDADHLHAFILEERVKEADGVAAAADAGDQQVGQALFLFQNLPARLDADDAVEIAHHHRVGMRAVSGAEDVMGGADVGHPIAHGLVDRLLQRGLAGGDGHDRRAEEFHTRDVERLALHIDRAHVDHALEAEPRRDGGRGDAVLARAGLGDDPRFAHALGQEDLAKGVVDLVRAGVQQVLALEVNFRAAQFFGQPLGEIERRGPARRNRAAGRRAPRQSFCPCTGPGVFGGQFVQGRHQRLGHEHAAVRAEMAGGVRLRGGGGGGVHMRAQHKANSEIRNPKSEICRFREDGYVLVLD